MQIVELNANENEMSRVASFYSGKKVLVTGGTGMIGKQLVPLLLDAGAIVHIVSLDDPSRAPEEIHFIRSDLREFNNCLIACEGMDIVFHLAGVKGSPAMTAERPASFFVPTLTFSLNMMEAARRCRVENYLFTSSVGVYSPAEIFFEDSVWETFPSKNDWFAGWAKRMGELQAEAYRIEYGWDAVSIVRPANVYGPFDNFDPENSMVVPALIRRACESDGTLSVWGDGSAVRDFIHSRDVARGMMLALENRVSEPINLGSGSGISIRELVEIIVQEIGRPIEIKWDISKPSGDPIRILNAERSRGYGFEPVVSLKEGVEETVKWFLANKTALDSPYNPFTESVLSPQND